MANLSSFSFKGVKSEEDTSTSTVSGFPNEINNNGETFIEFFTQSPHFQLNNGDKMIFPFSPPILQTTVPDNMVNLLLEEGRKLNIVEDDMNFNLAGNLKFGRSYRYKKEFLKSVEPFILDKVRPLFEVGETFFKADIPKEPYLDSIWINFSEQFDFNPPHVHNRDISFVIYLDVPPRIFSVQADSQAQNAGKIIFEYGEQISPYVNNGFDVEPYRGLMFIFPSKLRHYVPSFWVDEQRISVAGNIGFNLI